MALQRRCSYCRHSPSPSLTRKVPRLHTPSIELAASEATIRIYTIYTYTQMGKKPGGAGWLATVRKVFKPSKDQRHAKKRTGEAEGAAAGSGDAAEIVSVDHFPTAETSPEVTNEGSGSGAVAWRELGEHEEVAGAARRGRRGMAAVTAASRVARTAAAHRRAGSREERAAVRIQAFYRGYLLDELDNNMDERSGGWGWLEHCHAGVQASQQGPAETSYVTAAATDGVSENTVEMEAASRRSPTRDLYPVRPPVIPGYMAATQSARAKARMAPVAATKVGARSRSGSVAPGGGSAATANFGWSM
ncbi:unnamed protein product, partial [Urochloa humidicola]